MSVVLDFVSPLTCFCQDQLACTSFLLEVSMFFFFFLAEVFLNLSRGMCTNNQNYGNANLNNQYSITNGSCLQIKGNNVRIKVSVCSISTRYSSSQMFSVYFIQKYKKRNIEKRTNIDYKPYHQRYLYSRHVMSVSVRLRSVLVSSSKQKDKQTKSFPK